MPALFVRNLTAGNSNASGTTVDFTIPVAVPAGNLIVVFVGFDNLTATTPIVSSIAKQAGETANWVQIGKHDASVATGAAAVRGELWAILTTVQWATGAKTVTLSAAVVKKAVIGREFSGVTTALRGTAGTGTHATGSPTATTGGTAPATGDLVLGGAAFETTATPTADADTLNGSWSAAVVYASSGGAANTNVAVTSQYKIVTAGGQQTYNPSSAGVDSGACVVALVPMPEPSITQAAYRFYEEGTETGAVALGTAQDTPITGDLNNGDTSGQLRIRLQSTTAVAVPATDDWQLQYEKNASGTWVNVTTSSPVAAAYDSPNLTAAAATTSRLGAGTGSFEAGEVTEDGVANDRGWSGNNYTELVYSLMIKAADVTNADTIRFRVLRNGSTNDLTYAQTPTIDIVLSVFATVSLTAISTLEADATVIASTVVSAASDLVAASTLIVAATVVSPPVVTAAVPLVATAMLVATCVAVAPAAGEAFTYIQGFETDSDGWYALDPKCLPTRASLASPSNPHTGAWSLRAVRENGIDTIDTKMYRDFTGLLVGSPVHVTMWVFRTNTLSANPCTFGVLGVAGEQTLSLQTGVWTYVTFSFTATSDTHTVYIGGPASGTPGRILQIDDVLVAGATAAAAATTVDAAVDLASVSTLNVGGVRAPVGAVGMSATSTLTTTAVRAAQPTVLLSAVSTLSTTAVRFAVVQAVVPMTATSTLTVAAVRTVNGSVALAGVSTLTVGAVKARPGVVAMTAAATLSVTAVVIGQVAGAVALAGTSTLTATAARTAMVAASLTTAATLTVGATVQAATGLPNVAGTGYLYVLDVDLGWQPLVPMG